jgi:4-amino-4-deoxy-L-arabinose transferase-like glycosyltransferase
VSRWAQAAPYLIALLFVLLGCALIPYAGIEGDEALFGWPIYGLHNRAFEITIFHRQLPLMVFPYIGSLKTFLCWPVLKLFGPNAWAVRLPVALIGGLTVIVFYRWMERMAGFRAAVAASLLLACDPSFILTDTFDWGPVAIEHLLLVCACLAIVSGRLTLGSFCLGFALWNKAVFVWALVGLSAGVLAVYSPELRRVVADRRTIARCMAAFVIAALPLIVYNMHSPNATAQANIHPSFAGFGNKLISLRNTLDGADLFNVIAAMDSEGSPKTPHSLPGRVACAIALATGRHEHDLFLYGLILALLCAPLWWRSPGRRVALFAIVFSVAAFLAMASLRYTGAAHHIVLLYPMPHALLGIALSTFRPSRLGASLLAVLVLANLLVVNQYIVQLERFGAYGLFTDALNPLASCACNAAGKTLYAIDLGIRDSLNLTCAGRQHLDREWMIPQTPAPEIQAMIADPNGLILNRTPGSEYFKGATDRLNAAARDAGYTRQLLATIGDSNGRAQFEVFRFVRAGSAAAPLAEEVVASALPAFEYR